MQDGSFMVCGFVPSDAEFKTTQTGKSMCRFSVKATEKSPVAEGQRGEAVWTSCQAWHDLARIASNIRKGDTVMAIGKIQTNEYEGKTYKNLVCEYINIMAKPNSAPAQQIIQNAQGAGIPTPESDFEEILNDGDVPF